MVGILFISYNLYTSLSDGVPCSLPDGALFSLPDDVPCSLPDGVHAVYLMVFLSLSDDVPCSLPDDVL